MKNSLRTDQSCYSAARDGLVICDLDELMDQEDVLDPLQTPMDIETSTKTSTNNNAMLLDPHTDPFAPRTGKTLFWRNVNMTLLGRKGRPNRRLLANVWGEVPETETTAIMGASGAGKTSLLNILAGRAFTHGRVKIEADVRLNNYSVDPTNIKVRKAIAFVAQDDSLHETTTPREAIRFSAKLRLPKSTTNEQLTHLAQRMVDELGLSSCADTVVGGPMLKGISGGERKRTSVGVELVVRPTMVFLDEPTSGLDSFSAVQVCQVLKKVANAGSSVVFTIHQPNSEIFRSFDQLILMHKGMVMFQGPVNSVSDHFACRGFPIPQNYNPADWVINVAQRNSVSELQQRGFFAKDSRIIQPPTIPTKRQDLFGAPILKDKSDDDDEARHGLFVQTWMLLVREFVFFYRNPMAFQARFGVLIILSVVIGTVFYDVGESDLANPFNLQSQLGAMMILMTFAIVGCAVPAISSFPEERPIFLREYSTNHYKILPYSLSRFLREGIITFVQMFIINAILYKMIKFRGSLMVMFFSTFTLAMASGAMSFTLGVVSRGNPKVALQLAPVVLLPQYLFSGFFVSPNLIPPALSWIQYICPLTYGVRIVAVEIFTDCSDNPFAANNCKMMLANLSANADDTWWNWLIILAQFTFFRYFSLYLLKLSAKKFC